MKTISNGNKYNSYVLAMVVSAEQTTSSSEHGNVRPCSILKNAFAHALYHRLHER
jgi:hypothetical protein